MITESNSITGQHCSWLVQFKPLLNRSSRIKCFGPCKQTPLLSSVKVAEWANLPSSAAQWEAWIVNDHNFLNFLSAISTERDYILHKALPGFFLCIFGSLTCLKKPVFSKEDLLQGKVPARLYWDLLTSGRY